MRLELRDLVHRIDVGLQPAVQRARLAIVPIIARVCHDDRVIWEDFDGRAEGRRSGNDGRCRAHGQRRPPIRARPGGFMQALARDVSAIRESAALGKLRPDRP